MKLRTLQGTEKALHGTALLPRSMHAAAGLRPPNSSQQWRRIAGHTQLLQHPIPVPRCC